MAKQTQDYAYVKFDGPYVEHGKIDLGQAGKTLVAFNRWFKKYKKDFVNTESDILLRAGAIREGSSEIQIFLDFLNSNYGHATVITGVASSVFKNLGIRDFLQQFMGTLGEQLALKVFAKGNKLTEEHRFAEDGIAKVRLKNSNGSKLVVSVGDWETFQKTGSTLNGFCNLEHGREESLVVGYHDSKTGKDRNVSRLTYNDKEYFQDVSDPEEWARRLSEPFDESKAIDVKIVGQFIDYYGLAHKYHFSFQARKQQDVYGKHKILCIVEKDDIDKILDWLKPNNRKNICIKGLATKDREGKIDKIKIEWINEDPGFNPDQVGILD